MTETNPSASRQRRLEVMDVLGDELRDVIGRHIVSLDLASENPGETLTSVMQCLFTSILFHQATVSIDRSMTIGEHMKLQYEAGRLAYQILARVNESRWNDPLINKDIDGTCPKH